MKRTQLLWFIGLWLAGFVALIAGAFRLLVQWAY